MIGSLSLNFDAAALKVRPILLHKLISFTIFAVLTLIFSNHA